MAKFKAVLEPVTPIKKHKIDSPQQEENHRRVKRQRKEPRGQPPVRVLF